MNADELKQLQTPLKEKYKADGAAAKITMHAEGQLEVANVACHVSTSENGAVSSGLHPLAGGDGSWACSGDMLLQSLAACAGVTLGAVATAMGLNVRGGTVRVEGDMDFRGTLGVNREVPVGFQTIRVIFQLDTDATEEQVSKLVELTERYCVVHQTLSQSVQVSATASVA